MRLPDVEKSLIVIVGPTAVGKTEFSIQLAKKIHGEIVSSDSRLFYKGMDIGTAKPSHEEQRAVVHHLIDIISPEEKWSLADFQREAVKVIEDIHRRGKIPILVGGTGQYVWGLLQGWSLTEIKPSIPLREVLEKWGRDIGPSELHKKLAILDPIAASRIEPKNLRRTVRAIEVILTTGETFSGQYKKGGNNYSILVLGLKRDREEIYRRIDERIDSMIKNGLIEEIERLLEKGYSPSLPAFSAIGYSQLISYLQGKISLEEAIRLIKRQSRIFVRRQANWFKEQDNTIHWFDAGQPEIMKKVMVTVHDPSCWTMVEKKNG
jgi:tRNA dimethylallyltransferase